MVLRSAGAEPDWLGLWLPGACLTGIGIGLAFPTLGSAAVRDIADDRFATASAVNAAFRQVGAVLGTAILVAIVGDPAALGEALSASDGAYLFGGDRLAARRRGDPRRCGRCGRRPARRPQARRASGRERRDGDPDRERDAVEDHVVVAAEVGRGGDLVLLVADVALQVAELDPVVDRASRSASGRRRRRGRG